MPRHFAHRRCTPATAEPAARRRLAGLTRSKPPTVRTVLEESFLSSLTQKRPKQRFSPKLILQSVAPRLTTSALTLQAKADDDRFEQAVLRIDEQSLSRQYKLGLLYCRAGQTTEEEMYNNESGGPALDDFMAILGTRVAQKGHAGFRGGLDVHSARAGAGGRAAAAAAAAAAATTHARRPARTDGTTGTEALYTLYADCEIMFHVSTLLPYTPGDRQQLQRKRHIGNDIVTIIFQEPGAPPFSPKVVHSHFQHIFIVVRAEEPCTPRARYRVAVVRFEDVPPFGPRIPRGAAAVFEPGDRLRRFLLTKLINAENAAYRSGKFAAMARRTRQMLLADLVATYASQHGIDAVATVPLPGASKGLLERTSRFARALYGRSGKSRSRPDVPTPVPEEKSAPGLRTQSLLLTPLVTSPSQQSGAEAAEARAAAKRISLPPTSGAVQAARDGATEARYAKSWDVQFATSPKAPLQPALLTIAVDAVILADRKSTVRAAGCDRRGLARPLWLNGCAGRSIEHSRHGPHQLGHLRSRDGVRVRAASRRAAPIRVVSTPCVAPLRFSAPAGSGF